MLLGFVEKATDLDLAVPVDTFPNSRGSLGFVVIGSLAPLIPQPASPSSDLTAIAICTQTSRSSAVRPFLATPRQGVEAQRAGDRHVETVKRSREIEAGDRIAGVAGQPAQTLALGAE